MCSPPYPPPPYATAVPGSQQHAATFVMVQPPMQAFGPPVAALPPYMLPPALWWAPPEPYNMGAVGGNMPTPSSLYRHSHMGGNYSQLSEAPPPLYGDTGPFFSAKHK